MAESNDKNIKEEIENKIIDLIALGAGGRLIVFKPENLNKDLVVEKKGGYKNKVIYLNVYGKKEINQLAGKDDLKANEDFYLMFVNFDIVKQNIEDSFLIIPSLDLKNLSEENDFSKFLTNKKEFVRFLIKAFDKK